MNQIFKIFTLKECFFKINTFFLFSITFCSTNYFVFSQQIDLSKTYQVIRAEGEVPSILTNSVDDVLSSQIETSIITEEKDQLEFANFAKLTLRNIFSTGDVLFGDPLTKYVNKIGKRLLKSDTEISQDIDFFVFKSDYSNALVVEPGVVFVTTGMLAQIENEAQLAFVLAHELMHHKEKHIQKSFVEKEADSFDPSSSFLELSHLYKEHEIDADIKAVKLYHDAGYSKGQLNNVFLMLMYSYLPFDEVPVDSSFFDNEKVYIPNSYFPESPNPIESFQEYNDLLSTHPNIKRRIEEVGKEYEKFTNWQDNIHFFPVEEFEYIRDVARFENVRLNFLYGDFVKSMYEIFLLNSKYPNNEYLAELKAIIWFELNKIYLSGGKFVFFKDKLKEQGDISSLYHFINKLNGSEMGLLSMRIIEDISQKFPNNTLIKDLKDEQIKAIAHNTDLDIKTLEKISFYDALALSKEESLVEKDEKEETEANDSKYSKIAKIQQKSSSSKSTRPLTDDNFAYYLLFDLVTDDSFVENYDREYKEFVSKQKSSDTGNEVDIQDRELLLIYSQFYAVKDEKLNLSETQKFKESFDHHINKRVEKSKIHDLRFDLFSNFTAEDYNKTNILVDYIRFQNNVNSESLNFYYPDQNEFSQYLTNYKNSLVLFFIGTYRLEDRSLYGSFTILDIEKNEIDEKTYFLAKANVAKSGLGALLGRLLKRL